MGRYIGVFIGLAIGVLLVNAFKGQAFDRADAAHLFGAGAALLGHWLASISA